jgi:hypothetical protein
MDEHPVSSEAGIFEILLKASELHCAAGFMLLLLEYAPDDPINLKFSL